MTCKTDFRKIMEGWLPRHPLFPTTTPRHPALIALSIFLSFFFVFPAPAITISNLPAASISSTSAVLSATLADIGSTNPSVVCYYGRAPGGTNPAIWASSNVLGATPAGTVELTVSNLTPAAWYYFTFHAADPSNSIWSAPDGYFSTTPRPPDSYPSTSSGRAVMADADGVLLSPAALWLANKDAILTAIGAITNEADFFSWLSTNTYLRDNLGDWAGTWQGLETNSFLPADHPAAEISDQDISDWDSAAAAVPGVESNLSDHVSDTDNPHGVTPEQIGAAPAAHTQDWSTISNPPSTLAGYGITDAVPADDADYLSILSSMTNFVAVASPSNYLAYDPNTRTLTGCITNLGAGGGGEGVNTNTAYVFASNLYAVGWGQKVQDLGLKSDSFTVNPNLGTYIKMQYSNTVWTCTVANLPAGWAIPVTFELTRGTQLDGTKTTIYWEDDVCFPGGWTTNFSLSTTTGAVDIIQMLWNGSRYNVFNAAWDIK